MMISPFRIRLLVIALLMLVTCTPRMFAQNLASIGGTVSDAAGGVVPSAAVTATNTETGAGRATVTDSSGFYQFLALPVGVYQVAVTKDGFQGMVRDGITLVVGQRARVNLTLAVGQIQQQVTVTGEAPMVNNTTADISGLVGEREIKDLPLNGRSYDELATLNPGVVNFTWEKTGGIGISNSSTANMFSVNGNRPQQNLFLLNGVEYTGAAENNMQPGGASGQLLGVDAVREFNILRDNYGAEYGKHPGGQVLIVTQSGTNQWHGSLFEFVRDNALNAPNFFDLGSAPPFLRNQFGGSVGGPIQHDKTFIFANYEGFRQSLNQTSVELVPDAQSRMDAAPIVKSLGILNLWPVAPVGAPDFPVSGADGIAEVFLSPLQTIREDFGTARIDHVFSKADTAAAIYTIDDSGAVTATPANAYSTDIVTLREQVISLQETHVFSSNLLNNVQFGYSRAGYFFTGEPTPGTPAATVPGFIAGLPVGAVVVGGSQLSNPQAQLGLAGSNNGSNLTINRSLFTTTDQVTWAKGRNTFSFGVWFQPYLSDETLALSQYGQMTFTGLPALISGTASLLYNPAPTPMDWRALFGAWYAEDVIRVTRKLTVSLGFRDEFSNGMNEANGNAANYTYPNGIISTTPNIGTSLFTVNRAKFLPQPRISAAWSPLGPKTVIRAAFGMYNDLQDALGYRADQNAPFNSTYTIASGPLTALTLPINPAAPPPATALLVPGGIQPDMYTPTIVSWTLKIDRELTPNTSLSIAYVGNHGYHELIGADANAPKPVECPASPCPATFPTTTYINPTTLMSTPVWGALSGQPVPAGTFYIAPGTKKPNPLIANTWTWFSEGTSEYNALQIDVRHRFSKGLSFRGVYTYAKAMDDGDSLNATAAMNAPALVSNPYDIHADWGPATYDVRHLAVINATYELPIGTGKQFWGDASGATGQLISGWSLTSIVTVQSGFPFTPQLGFNPSNDGDTRNPVRPFLNPDFTGPVVTGNSSQWFNPNAFIAPANNSGFFGNVGRNTYTGPGLADWDFSVLKDTTLRENLHLQFRAEIFNLLNRANFDTPNLIVAVLLPAPNATVPVVSPSGGLVTATSTTSRQVQFGLKLLW